MPDVSGELPNTGSGTEAFAYIGLALLGLGLVLCRASHRLRASQLSRSLLGALYSLPLFAVQAMSASSIGVVVLITWVRTGHAPSRFEGLLLVGMGLGLVGLAVSAADGHALHTGWLFRCIMWLAVVMVVWVSVACQSYAWQPRQRTAWWRVRVVR